MRTFLNIIWHFPFFGFLFALAYALAGVFWCVTIIGFPIGLGMFQLSFFLFSPFSKAMVSRQDLALVTGDKQGTGLAAFSFLIRILYFPFGLFAAIGTVMLIIGEFLSLIGIPSGIVWAKALDTIFNPVNKVCVPKIVAEEIERRKNAMLLGQTIEAPNIQVKPSEVDIALEKISKTPDSFLFMGGIVLCLIPLLRIVGILLFILWISKVKKNISKVVYKALRMFVLAFTCFFLNDVLYVFYTSILYSSVPLFVADVTGCIVADLIGCIFFMNGVLVLRKSSIGTSSNKSNNILLAVGSIWTVLTVMAGYVVSKLILLSIPAFNATSSMANYMDYADYAKCAEFVDYLDYVRMNVYFMMKHLGCYMDYVCNSCYNEYLSDILRYDYLTVPLALIILVVWIYAWFNILADLTLNKES